MLKAFCVTCALFFRKKWKFFFRKTGGRAGRFVLWKTLRKKLNGGGLDGCLII